MPRTQPSRIAVRTFLLMFVPLAIAAAAWGARPLREVHRAESGTRTTAGTVVSTSVETLPCYGMCKGGPSYRPRITYRYEVGERAYLSDNVTSISDAGYASWAADVVERHPPRSRAVVYYRVSDPAFAYLEPARTWAYWALAILPMAIVAAFGFALARASRAT